MPLQKSDGRSQELYEIDVGLIQGGLNRRSSIGEHLIYLDPRKGFGYFMNYISKIFSKGSKNPSTLFKTNFTPPHTRAAMAGLDEIKTSMT